MKMFCHEAKTLMDIRKKGHDHLAEILTAFRQENEMHFVFQWADGGNLRDFWIADWREYPPSLVKETATQLKGLAEGLVFLHKKNTRHGDLKPENILRFMTGTFLGTLKLADFGLAKEHVELTEQRQNPTSTKYTTIRYEAPEFNRNLSRKNALSRLYDVWSFGCVILEHIIWHIEGRGGLDKLLEGLTKGNGDNSPFYKSYEDHDEVHPFIQQTITDMAKTKCAGSDTLHKLLQLVRDKLLVVDVPSSRHWQRIGVGRLEAIPTNSRTSAVVMLEDLEAILGKLKDKDETTGARVESGVRQKRKAPEVEQPRRARKIAKKSVSQTGKTKPQRQASNIILF